MLNNKFVTTINQDVTERFVKDEDRRKSVRFKMDTYTILETGEKITLTTMTVRSSDEGTEVFVPTVAIVRGGGEPVRKFVIYDEECLIEAQREWVHRLEVIIAERWGNDLS